MWYMVRPTHAFVGQRSRVTGHENEKLILAVSLCVNILDRVRKQLRTLSRQYIKKNDVMRLKVTRLKVKYKECS